LGSGLSFPDFGNPALVSVTAAFLKGYNLSNPRNHDLYNSLTGGEIQKEAFWQAFKESAERRNRAVHEGAVVAEAEAKASYEAAKSGRLFEVSHQGATRWARRISRCKSQSLMPV
jgi:hypothetical protein